MARMGRRWLQGGRAADASTVSTSIKVRLTCACMPQSANATPARRKTRQSHTVLDAKAWHDVQSLEWCPRKDAHTRTAADASRVGHAAAKCEAVKVTPTRRVKSCWFLSSVSGNRMCGCCALGLLGGGFEVPMMNRTSDIIWGSFRNGTG